MAKTKKTQQTVPVEENSTGTDIFKTFNVKFGDNPIIRLSEDSISSVKEFIDTGSYLLNDIISHGRGWPVGRVVTITGKKSSGKSTLVAHLIAAAQKIGAMTVLNDSECAFDEARARAIGVNTDDLFMVNPDYLEMALDQIEEVIKLSKQTNKMIVFAWDSIAATPTKSEVQSNIGEGGHYGEHAKLMSQGLRKLMKLVASNRMLLILVNQVKEKIGASMYEPKTSFIAQNPLEYGSHVMIEIAQCGVVKDNNDVAIGIMSRAKVTKNRLAPPFRTAEIPIMFDIGIDRALEALEIGKKYNRARLKGAWNQIIKPCDHLNANEKGKCPDCENTGYVQDERFKQFYSKDIREIVQIYPGLEHFLVTGDTSKLFLSE